MWYCDSKDFIKRNNSPSQLYREPAWRMTFPMKAKVIDPWSLIISTLVEALSVTEMIYQVWQVFFKGYFYSKRKKQPQKMAFLTAYNQENTMLP